MSIFHCAIDQNHQKYFQFCIDWLLMQTMVSFVAFLVESCILTVLYGSMHSCAECSVNLTRNLKKI